MSDKVVKLLRGFGSLGGWAANILQFLSSIFPGLTMSAAGAAVAFYFQSVLDWVQQPAVYVSAIVFIFILWTYIGLIMLRDRNRPKLVKIAHDPAYGMILDGGVQPTLVSLGEGKYGVMLGIAYRNVSAGPLRLRVCPGRSGWITEVSQHEANGGEAQEGERFA
jgi:hypothetical protein